MLTEKSCGAIVYRKHHGNTEIMLIKHLKSGCWSFPKGHMESGESEVETAIREVSEETGLEIHVDAGFRETVVFSPRKDVVKTVVYFIGRVRRGQSRELTPQYDEVAAARWVEVSLLKDMLTFENDKIVAAKAGKFIRAGSA